MQKTQVLKLNTSKDNIEAFFDKMKDKFVNEQEKSGNLQNYDITMIVKHESKGSFKENVNESANKKSQTLKSILSQSDPNAKYSGHQHDKQIEDIFDEEMHIQPNTPSKQVMKHQTPYQESKLKQKVNGRKVRDSNKMPSNETIFQFKKKQQSDSNTHIHKANNYFTTSQKNNNQKQPELEQQSNEDQGSDSSNSQFQQRQEEELKKNVSHRYVDIFPNIQINAIVSEKLFSLKNVNRSEAKRVITSHHRRCSIDNENLLSPKMHDLVNAEVKQQSTKEISQLLKNKLSVLSSKEENYFSVPDAINQVNEIDEQMRNRKKAKKSSTSIGDLQHQDVQNIKSQQKDVLTRSKAMKKTRDRMSAMAKRSIFQTSQGSNNKISKNRIQFTEGKISDGYVINVPNTEQNQHIVNNQPDTSSDEDQKSSSSSNEQPEESIHVIENKLNDCIGLIDKNELSVLENFLYQFKNKYFYVSSTRVQIKWRLLMAHCKENKKEFERAAINYNNVINLAKENPKSLTIEPADVYQRLGVCYTQIAWWNKGILAFTEALNRYKRNKNIIKYAECMNNLGALYLQAESINLAEKCFIQSYHLKKSLYGKNTTNLLTSLFNIFQCNLLTKNYDQAQKVIQVISEQIIQKIPQKQSNKLLYLGGLYRRFGKMYFLRGKINSAEQNYLKSFEMLSHKYPYCMEFGELMSCLGILKLEEKKYKEAKQYYDKAIMLMNFYCPKDSRTIHTLKKNLQYTVKMIMEERQGNSSRRSGLD